jgi:hypothetical protein
MFDFDDESSPRCALDALRIRPRPVCFDQRHHCGTRAIRGPCDGSVKTVIRFLRGDPSLMEGVRRVIR